MQILIFQGNADNFELPYRIPFFPLLSLSLSLFFFRCFYNFTSDSFAVVDDENEQGRSVSLEDHRENWLSSIYSSFKIVFFFLISVLFFVGYLLIDLKFF